MKGCPHTRKIICCNYAYMIYKHPSVYTNIKM